MGTRMSQFITKMLFTSCHQQYYSHFRMALHTISLIQLIFGNQQTYHKSHTLHFIDHVQTCIIVTNNSDSAKKTTTQNYNINNVRKPIAAY